jgi:hypothetical protein
MKKIIFITSLPNEHQFMHNTCEAVVLRIWPGGVDWVKSLEITLEAANDPDFVKDLINREGADRAVVDLNP